VRRWFHVRLLVVLLLPPPLPVRCGLGDDCAVATWAGPVRVATMIRGGLLPAVLMADLMADVRLVGAEDSARAMSSSSDGETESFLG
jgi:hypothetical protein